MPDPIVTSDGGAPAADPVAAPSTTPADQPWYASIEDPEVRGVAEIHKWDSPGAAVKSYRELEKLRGVPADRLLTIPAEDAKPEEWAKFYDRVGRPAKPEDYALPVPADYGDPEFAKAAATKFHELGLSKKQANDLAIWWNGEQMKVIEGMQAERDQESEIELQELRREWGSAYDQREELGRRAVRTFASKNGWSVDDLEAIEEAVGTAKCIKFFAAIGEGLGEAGFPESSRETPNFGVTPAGARARFDQLKMDKEWVGKALTVGSAENAEWDRLTKIIASGG